MGLLAEIDALITSCRTCGGLGRFDGSACPYCALARQVRALVYRARALTPAAAWTFGPVTARADGRIEPLGLADRLSPRSRILLLALVRRAPAAASFGELAPHLEWLGSWTEQDMHAVHMLVSRLRPRLAPYRLTIRNQPGFGYRLEEVVP